MGILETVLPIIIYFLLIIIIIIGIILGMRLIKTMDKIDALVDDVEKKVKSLDGVFNVMDFMTDKLSGLSEKLMDIIGNLITKLFTNKRKKERIDEEWENEN